MGKVFSPDQRRAIDTRDRTLLVSAAAGSGKTTTLTERIIVSLLDGERPESLQDMLIVTFTNAAVADLEEKIGEALTEAVRNNPDNKRLERELYLLPSAKIRTIDAFCGEILRANADRAGVSPSYRIAEKAEVSMLTGNVLDALISAAYNGELAEYGISASAFEELASALTDAKRTSELASVFEALYEKCKNSIEGVDIFTRLAEIYSCDKAPVEHLPYGKDIMAYAKSTLSYYKLWLTEAAKELDGGTDAECAYAYFLEEVAGKLESAYSESYLELRRRLDISYPEAPTTKAPDKTEAFLIAKKRFERAKAQISLLKKKFFLYSEDEWWELFRGLHSVCSTLSSFLHIFDRMYTAEKMRRALLEYSDIERLAYKCLYNDDGTFSDIAKAYQRSLSSIYIDEYQDVNELQDAIFYALSNGRNRFMVGDIKQSIYVFRSAKPEIFANMKKEFTPIELAEPGESSTIFMSENFRCDKGIVDFVNSVFDRLFNVTRDSIGYVDGDRLKYAKIYENGICPDEAPTLYLLDKKAKEKPDEGDDGEEDDGKSMSARFVAERIVELLRGARLAGGEKIKPKDIAIILRSRTHLEEYKEALTKAGVPINAGDDKSFFMNSEVRLALALLSAIDNPQRDIKLTALMSSPIFEFSADELLKYRQSSRGGTLYRALLSYSENHPEDAKLSGFLSKLSYYRTISEGIPVDKLIARLYEETGLLSLAKGKAGALNLTMLWAFARKFERSSYKGLYNFLSYIDTIVRGGGTIVEKGATVSDGSVTITTSHSSKGLEFPVVFFVECGRELCSGGPNKPPFSYTEDYGLSLHLSDPSGVVLDNPIYHMIEKKGKLRELEEELRVLYVTLTRAREKLFIVADLPTGKSADDFISTAELNSDILSPRALEGMKTFADWIIACQPRVKLCHIEWQDERAEEENCEGERGYDEKREELDEALLTLLRERLAFTYKNTAETRFPEKLSVSRLYPEVLDDADTASLRLAEMEGEREVAAPIFISGVDDELSAKRGIATHLFLQFCDLDNLYKNGVACELQRLCDMGFISSENAKLVRLDELEKFLRSRLFSDMRSAKRIYREFRFNSRLDASHFAKNEERQEELLGKKILVQGVIDCIIVDDAGELHLIDYKTDRLSREELSDIELARRRLRDKHSTQLSYYALACEAVFGKAPRTVSVYSLPLGMCLEI